MVIYEAFFCSNSLRNFVIKKLVISLYSGFFLCLPWIELRIFLHFLLLIVRVSASINSFTFYWWFFHKSKSKRRKVSNNPRFIFWLFSEIFENDSVLFKELAIWIGKSFSRYSYCFNNVSEAPLLRSPSLFRSLMNLITWDLSTFVHFPTLESKDSKICLLTTELLTFYAVSIVKAKIGLLISVLLKRMETNHFGNSFVYWILLILLSKNGKDM